MTLRKLPGAAGLGLLAFLAAHAATFGGEHSVGGAYHGAILAAAIAAGAGFALAAVAVACAGRGKCADGSVFASRLSALLPSIRATVAASAGWFALVEGGEGAHAVASLPLVIAALLVACWAVHWCARALLHFVGTIALVVAKLRFAPRTHVWIIRAHETVRALSEPARTRRFARPPPGSMLAPASI